jgi:hypothetical protein
MARGIAENTTAIRKPFTHEGRHARGSLVGCEEGVNRSSRLVT